ncbi:MAG: DNA-3-methyladenine glycosylase [Bacteroidota bacterium]
MFESRSRLAPCVHSDGGRGTIKAAVPLGKTNRNNIAISKKYVSDWLDLDRDLGPFYALGEKDKILAPLVRQFYGLRLIGIPDLFEALAWAIIGQQINLNFAYSLKRKLVEGYGQSIEYPKQPYYLFPTAKTIALLSPSDLRPLQFSQRKAEYLIDLAKLMEEDALNKEDLSQMDFESAKKKLMAIRGIGNWTANYVIMKCLHYPDAFPVEDAGLHNALKAQLKMARKPTLEEIHRWAENWSGWRAYATFYLWQSLLK